MVARFKVIRIVDHQHSIVLANYTDCKSMENILFLIVKLLNTDMKNMFLLKARSDKLNNVIYYQI